MALVPIPVLPMKGTTMFVLGIIVGLYVACCALDLIGGICFDDNCSADITKKIPGNIVTTEHGRGI